MDIKPPADWIGPLLSVCDIGDSACPVWLREISDPSQPAQPTDFISDSESDDEVFALFDRSDAESELGEPGLGGQLVVAEPSGAAPWPDAASSDFAEFNRKNRMTANEFVCGHPGPNLVLLCLCLTPLCSMMRSLLHMASDAWDAEQVQAHAQGRPIKYRILECARTTFTQPILLLMAGMLRPDAHVWLSLPAFMATVGLSLLVFQMLMRGCGAMWFNVHRPHNRLYPVVLFRLLDPDITGVEIDDIVGSRPCAWDHSTKAFRKIVVTREQVTSKKAFAILLVVAVF